MSFAEAWRIAGERIAQRLPADLLKRAHLTPEQREEQARIHKSTPRLVRNADDSRRRIAARERALDEAQHELARLRNTCVPQQRAQRGRPRGSQRRVPGNARLDQTSPPPITPPPPEGASPAAEASESPGPEAANAPGAGDDDPPESVLVQDAIAALVREVRITSGGAGYFSTLSTPLAEDIAELLDARGAFDGAHVDRCSGCLRPLPHGATDYDDDYAGHGWCALWCWHCAFTLDEARATGGGR